MQSKIQKIACLVLTMILLVSLLPTVTVQAAKTKIKLNMKQTILFVGEQECLEVKGLTIKTVKFKSSKPSVVSVTKNGKLTAKKAGKATITVMSKNDKKIKATCKVTVKRAAKTKQITLEQEGSVRLDLLKTFPIKVKSVKGISSSDMVYSSNNKKIATVDEKGVIKGLFPGTAKITIKSSRNPKVKTTFTVNVSNSQTENVVISREDFDISGFYDGGLSLNGRIYDNYMDFVSAGGRGNHYIMYNENDSEVNYKTFKTKRGIKLGDSLEKVVKAYDNVFWYYSESSYKNFNTDDHICKHILGFTNKESISLRFYMDQNDTVMAITIGK